VALSRSWPCSSLDLHPCSHQGSSSQLLDYKFLGLARDIIAYEGLQQPFRRPHIRVMWARVPTRSALLNSMSIAQQHCGYLIDYHQSQLKRESRRMKTPTAMANHDPRMNRTNPKYRALLGIVGTWGTSCDFCNCSLIALCVLDVFCSCHVCFLSVCCYFELVLVLGPSALETLKCAKRWIGSLSRMCFPLIHLCLLE
jgi:hypothetical protein